MIVFPGVMTDKFEFELLSFLCLLTTEQKSLKIVPDAIGGGGASPDLSRIYIAVGESLLVDFHMPWRPTLEVLLIAHSDIRYQICFLF